MMKSFENRYERIKAAWGNLRPTKSFAGLSLQQFTATTQSCVDCRTKVADLSRQLQAAIEERVSADQTAAEIIDRVVNAVRAEKEEGSDGELYGSMGFVRRSERKTAQRRIVKLAA